MRHKERKTERQTHRWSYVGVDPLPSGSVAVRMTTVYCGLEAITRQSGLLWLMFQPCSQQKKGRG
jgi:hypothetical protein